MRSLLSCGRGICVENEGSDLSACRRYAGRFSQTWKTLSMVEPALHSLFFVPPSEEKELHDRTLIAMEQVRTRGGTAIALMFQGDKRANAVVDQSIELPSVSILLAPLMQMIVAQMFSYYVALELGRNIDKPRNLAKSVTVG